MHEDFVVSLISSKQMMRYHPKLGHDRLPPNPFHLIIHRPSYTILGWGRNTNFVEVFRNTLYFCSAVWKN